MFLNLCKHLFYLCDLADVIIYLDIPVGVRRFRILTRFIKQKFGIEKCNYPVNFEMLKLMYKWTNDFEKNKNEFELMLDRYTGELIKLNNKTEIKRYLKNILCLSEYVPYMKC